MAWLRSILRWRDIPAGIWAVGFVSLLMDVSSEMIHALLPAYLVTVLGVSMLTVGLLEGVAEAIAQVVKVFSGALSDWLGKRKLLAVLGYGLAALTKPVFPLAQSLGWIMAARFVDRLGKGIRGAPRDALIADITPADLRGASFGLRQSLDTVGAVLGPAAAILLMALSGDQFTFVFWIAVIPAFMAVAVLIVGVQEPSRHAETAGVRAPLSRRELAKLGRPFWIVVAIASVFTFARFSEAFLLLRAQSAGVPLALVPAALALMNVAYALSAWPAGALSDQIGRYPTAAMGLVALIAADLLLALAENIVLIGAGVALWGLHMGLTQGLFAALVADTAHVELRGTAFGVFHLITGAATLAASVIAGALWDAAGAAATFAAGALFAALSLGALIGLRGRAATPHR